MMVRTLVVVVITGETTARQNRTMQVERTIGTRSFSP